MAYEQHEQVKETAMKILIMFAFILASAQVYASGWALLTLNADGEEIDSGAFVMSGGEVALFSQEECAGRAVNAVLESYSFSTQFEYLGNGVFNSGGDYARVACIISAGDLNRYAADPLVGDVNIPMLFESFGDVLDTIIAEDRVRLFSLFPMGDAEGFGRAVDGELERLIVMRQRTSFNCDAPGLGTAANIVCHDARLAAYDLELQSLIDRAMAIDPRRFQDLRPDFEDEKQGIFFPAGLEQLYRDNINRLNRRLQAV